MSDNAIAIPEEKVDTISSHALELVETAKSIEVTDQESYAEADQSLKIAVAAKKKVKGFIKELVDPFKKAVKSAEGKLKPLLVPYEEADKLLRGKMEVYIAEENRKAREEAARQAEAERKKQAELEAARKKAEAENKPLPEPEPEPAPEPVAKPQFKEKSDLGSSYTVRKWTFKEVDFEKVPDEYKQLDSKAINAAIKNGERNIPGLEIYEKESIAVRT